MRIFRSILVGIAVAVSYALLSFALAGKSSVALSVALGAVVSLIVSGFRSRKETSSRANRQPQEDPVKKVVEPVSSERPIEVPQSATKIAERVDLPVFASQEKPPPHVAPQPSLSAEELFSRAYEIPHQEIPDVVNDREFLMMLRDSARLGYAPAMAKLGEYAVRRRAWVEAYYWTWCANRCGMDGLERVLRMIRGSWTMEGRPDEETNAYELFSSELGSIGRALLDIDSGHNVALAKDFLREHRPEFL